MKVFLKIILLITMLFSLLAPVYVWAAENLKINGGDPENTRVNNHLDILIPTNWNKFFKIDQGWSKWIVNLLVSVAYSMKSIIFLVAWVYFLILVLKLLYTDNSEEEADNFKKWIIWITIWLIITQSAYWFVSIIFDKDIWQKLWADLIVKVINPLLWLLLTIVSFFFIWIAIYAFFKMVTSNGDEENVKIGKKSIIQAIIWFIAIKISGGLVNAIYWSVNCNNNNLSLVRQNCLWNVKLSWVSDIVVTLINWMNWFVWIFVVIMIIYTWLKVLFSPWKEDVLKEAKTSIIFIIVWIVILASSYLILNFFVQAS